MVTLFHTFEVLEYKLIFFFIVHVSIDWSKKLFFVFKKEKRGKKHFLFMDDSFPAERVICF